jgi:hypothetical protein
MPTDKPFKIAEHQRERQRVRQTLRTDVDDVAIPSRRAFGDPAKAPKDGKQYVRNPRYQHLLRK